MKKVIITSDIYNADVIPFHGNKYLIGNGYFGVRGTMEEYKKDNMPCVNLAGIYDKVGEKWRIGGSLKFLLGSANIDAHFNKAELTLGEDAWSAVTNAEIQASVKGFSYAESENEQNGHKYVSGFNFNGLGINGFGVAVDLG